MQVYSDPEREDDPHALPDVEVFKVTRGESGLCYIGEMILREDMEPGWYYQACFPGCLPDSDPVGPYDTKREAVKASQEWE